MTRHQSILRLHRIALWLAFTAVLSHVGLSLASVHHHARMLGSHPAGWTEVCTPSGTKRIAMPAAGGSDQSEESAAMARMADCLVCVAALSSFPLPGAVSGFDSHLPDRWTGRPAPADAVVQSFLSRHPPPRAPPRYS